MTDMAADRATVVAEGDDQRPARPHLDEPLLCAGEIAELFSVHPSTIRRLAREGRIPAYWVGTTPRFDADEVAQTLRRDVRQPPPAQPNLPAEARPSRRRAAELDRDRLRTVLYG